VEVVCVGAIALGVRGGGQNISCLVLDFTLLSQLSPFFLYLDDIPKLKDDLVSQIKTL